MPTSTKLGTNRVLRFNKDEAMTWARYRGKGLRGSGMLLLDATGKLVEHTDNIKPHIANKLRQDLLAYLDKGNARMPCWKPKTLLSHYELSPGVSKRAVRKLNRRFVAILAMEGTPGRMDVSMHSMLCQEYRSILANCSPEEVREHSQWRLGIRRGLAQERLGQSAERIVIQELRARGMTVGG